MRTSTLLFRSAFVAIVVLTPVIILLAPLPLLTSHTLLEWQYTRPSFPADEFGYTTEDRLRIGGIVVDYLQGNATLEVIEGITDDEESHMADVRDLFNLGFIILCISLAVVVLAFFALFSHTTFRKKAFIALQRAAQVTIALQIIGIVYFSYDWMRAFDRLHRVFFKGLNWMFNDDQVLLRLFPDEFWQATAILYVSVSVGLAVLLVIVTSKPIRRLFG